MPQSAKSTRVALDALSMPQEVHPAIRPVMAAAQGAHIQAQRVAKQVTQDAVNAQEVVAFSDGTRTRVRVGKQLDGTWGIQAWDASGNPVFLTGPAGPPGPTGPAGPAGASPARGTSTVTITGGTDAESGNIGHGLGATPSVVIATARQTSDARDDYIVVNSYRDSSYVRFRVRAGAAEHVPLSNPTTVAFDWIAYP